jgi:hypothetical protein
MLHTNQPCDPKIHAAAVAIAEQILWVIRTCLREEEWNDARYEMYHIARQVLELMLRDGD